MDSFHRPGYGLSSQFTVKATAKKMAKSMVGKSIGSDQRSAPNVPPVARSERARTGRDGPIGPGSPLGCRSARAAVDAPSPTGGDPGRRPRVGQVQPLALSASMSAGSTLCTSPTMPRSATEKIGASWSLLMATMFLEPFMPTRCWVAPEIPQAT